MSDSETLAARVAPTLGMHEVYAAALTADLDEAAMDACPGAGHENTPRFTIGHLCTGAALTRSVLLNPEREGALELDIDPVFEALFLRGGPQDRRLPERSASAPTRAALVSELGRQHEALISTVRETPEGLLRQSCRWKLGGLLPTLGDLVMFVCSHEALHLGQLASWRRATGRPAAMAAMVAEHSTSD